MSKRVKDINDWYFHMKRELIFIVLDILQTGLCASVIDEWLIIMSEVLLVVSWIACQLIRAIRCIRANRYHNIDIIDLAPPTAPW